MDGLAEDAATEVAACDLTGSGMTFEEGVMAPRVAADTLSSPTLTEAMDADLEGDDMTTSD